MSVIYIFVYSLSLGDTFLEQGGASDTMWSFSSFLWTHPVDDRVRFGEDWCPRSGDEHVRFSDATRWCYYYHPTVYRLEINEVKH